jgi:hypothetical protein
MNRKDIKIIQISSEPDKQREIRSHQSLSQLGYRYIRIINPKYLEYPPTENVIDGKKEWIVGVTKPDPNKWGLTSGHYGAWQGHMSAIFASFVDKDFTLICECDCLITVDSQLFRDRVDEAINLLENSDYKIVRFEAPNPNLVQITDQLSDNLYSANINTLGHCYLISSKHRNWWLDRFDNVGWHTPDWWLNFAFERVGERMAVFKNFILTGQAEGFSIVDNVDRPERVYAANI